MKILVTGSWGFVGSHLSKRFLSQGHTVIGVDNAVGGYKDNLTECKTYEIDCCDTDAIDHLFAKESFDLVVHCACTAQEGLSVVSPILITSNTYAATVNVVTASCKYKVKKFVFMSSMARYGDQKPPFIESQSPKPVDPYGIAKVAAEETVKCLCDLHGVQWSVAIPHNIYGPNQVYTDPYRNVVSIFLNRHLQGKPAIIYGDGNQMRSFSYIDDTLSVFDQICFDDRSNGELFNIGPDEDYVSIKELADICSNITGVNLAHQSMPGRPKEVKYATCSSNKIRKWFNYKTQTSLIQGIQKTYEYIKQRGSQPFNYSFELEIENDLTPTTWREKLI